tara:strand:+ start:1126 stop:1530 length:405 start_codon:yes stop_codon:yes gene_type:complete
MQLNIRKLKESDWDTLCSWWDEWPEWQNPPRDFLPDNGTGGLMVEKDVPIVAGFIYYTNSKGALLEWIVSNPKYKENDRKQAIELLINAAEEVCKGNGIKYMFSIGRNKSLTSIHKELGWVVDTKSSHELVKKI